MANKPIAKFRAGQVSAALWENDIKVDGHDRTIVKATVERRYKDRDGEWKSSGSFNRNEVALAIWCLQRCLDAMIENSSEFEVEEVSVQ